MRMFNFVAAVLLGAIASASAQGPARPLDALKPQVSKLGADSGILKAPPLADRLQKLMGTSAYQAMLKTWQTETPLKEEGGILHASGCQAHNCGDTGYELFVDPAGDNVNVYAFSKKAMKKYEEKGPIALPPGMAADFKATVSNRTMP